MKANSMSKQLSKGCVLTKRTALSMRLNCGTHVVFMNRKNQIVVEICLNHGITVSPFARIYAIEYSNKRALYKMLCAFVEICKKNNYFGIIFAGRISDQLKDLLCEYGFVDHPSVGDKTNSFLDYSFQIDKYKRFFI